MDVTIFNKSNKRVSVPRGAHLVDRSTPFGNPFSINYTNTRDEVCDKFERWVVTQPELILLAKRVLKGRDLVCWCAPLRCHAETWKRIANE